MIDTWLFVFALGLLLLFLLMLRMTLLVADAIESLK